MEMMLYKKYIRPMHSYPGPDYSPRVMPIEEEAQWYPEEERERLEEKYASYNEGSFSDLIFEEKFEPYAVEPQFKKLKVPEKCGECRSCNASITGSPYCRIEATSPINPQADISSIYVNIDSRPVWCPIIKTNDELNRMPFEERTKLEKLIAELSPWLGGEDLWEKEDKNGNEDAGSGSEG